MMNDKKWWEKIKAKLAKQIERIDNDEMPSYYLDDEEEFPSTEFTCEEEELAYREMDIPEEGEDQ